MLDHGQLGPPTPAVLSAANSRRPSMNDPKPLSPLASGAPAPRRASLSSGAKPVVGPPLSPLSGMSRRPSMHDSRARLGSITENRPLTQALLELDLTSAQIGRSASDALSDSAIDEDSTDEETTKSDTEGEAKENDNPPALAAAGGASAGTSTDASTTAEGSPPVLGGEKDSGVPARAAAENTDVVPPLPSQRPPLTVSSSFASPSDLAAQLSSHPKLTALRAPSGLALTPMSAPGAPSPTRSVPQTPGIAAVKSSNYFAPISPPILANPKCSGYFVEPVRVVLPPLVSCELGRSVPGGLTRMVGLRFRVTDEVDGAVPRGGPYGGQDHLSEQEVRREAGEL